MNLAQVFSFGNTNFPDTVAIHHGGHHLPYRQVTQDVERIAGHLFRCGVRPGQFVGTDSPNPVTHWLTLLALMRLGTVTVSLSRRYEEEAAALPELAMVLSDNGQARTYRSGIGRIRIEPNWIRDEPPAMDQMPSPEAAAAALGRISFTSGTTGRPKAVLLGSRLLHTRVAGAAERTGLTAKSRLWCGLGPDSSYGFVATLATWLAGGSIVFSQGGNGAFRYFAEHGVNQMIASPAALNALLRDAVSGSLPRLQATAVVGGGRLTVGMRDRLLDRVCPEIMVSFGSTEVGGIAMGNAAGLDGDGGNVGEISPEVDARILSDNGDVLPAGQTGHLWVTSPSAASSYLNDPLASTAHFSDGWFRTGDFARISEGGYLTIVGRSVDTLNLGGVKVAAAEIDAIASEFDMIEDACSIPLHSSDREAQLAIVIVGTVPDGNALASRIRARLPTMPSFLLASAPSIERSAMGKANRGNVADLVRKALSDPSGGQSGGIRLLGMF